MNAPNTLYKWGAECPVSEGHVNEDGRTLRYIKDNRCIRCEYEERKKPTVSRKWKATLYCKIHGPIKRNEYMQCPTCVDNAVNQHGKLYGSMPYRVRRIGFHCLDQHTYRGYKIIHGNMGCAHCYAKSRNRSVSYCVCCETYSWNRDNICTVCADKAIEVYENDRKKETPNNQNIA